MLKLSDAQYNQLSKVNKDVNNRLMFQTDEKQYGVADKWVLPERYGDCDDYVLEKRDILIKAGWNPLDLKIAICYTETNEGHAVLMVDTDRGTLVLDNRYGTLKTHTELKRIGYKFVKRQQGKRWVAIK